MIAKQWRSQDLGKRGKAKILYINIVNAEQIK